MLCVALQFSTGNTSESPTADESRSQVSPDMHRIVVVQARSSENAKKIARLLHNMIDKPIFIEMAAGEYEVQIGGIGEQNVSVERFNRVLWIRFRRTSGWRRIYLFLWLDPGSVFERSGGYFECEGRSDVLLALDFQRSF